MFNPFSAESYRFHPKPPEGNPKPDPAASSVEQPASVTPIEPAPVNPPSIEAIPQSPQAVEAINIPHEVLTSPEPNDLHSDAAKLVQEKTDQQLQDNPGAG